MKPASYQSVASSVMSPNMTLGHLLTTPNVMRCEKCRFATTDIADFKQHMAREHIEYYCFYCNSVSLSEAELQAHLKIHTATSPFKCPHCGQVYMRRMCLIKHIDRFHSKLIPQGTPKIASTKTPHVSVSCASQSVSSAADSSTHRPAVRVTVPTPNATGFRLDSNFQRLKSLNSYLSNVSHGDAVPLNGHVQRNRALTVALPEEVSIPAGCMVQVAEVMTADGTKELRLRFVAHQEQESVIKNGKTTVPETSKVLSSPMNYQNTASEFELRTENNKNHDPKLVNKEHPTRVPINVSKSLPNPSVKEQCRSSKRPSPEVINVDADVPSKISRNFITVGDPKVATNIDPINHNVTPTVISSISFGSRIISSGVQPENLFTRLGPRGVEERRGIQERPSVSASIMTNNVQSTPRIMPTNRGPVTMKTHDGILLQKSKQESTKPQQQSSKTQFLPLIPSVVATPKYEFQTNVT
uniref:C2H2-type domain-containing protein n=1 Tax=Neogobius melanostomus TaxID=47308 RepID=A0A8C6UHQ9_9GOBI